MLLFRFCVNSHCKTSFRSEVPKWSGTDGYNLMLMGSADIPEPLLSSVTPTFAQFDYGTGLQVFVAATGSDPIYTEASKAYLPITRQLYRHPLMFFQRAPDAVIRPQARGFESLTADEASVAAATMTGAFTVASSIKSNTLVLLVGGKQGTRTVV
jgi:hypothetical protein